MKTEREICALMALYNAALAWQINGLCQSGDYGKVTMDLELAITLATAVLNKRNIGAVETRHKTWPALKSAT